MLPLALGLGALVVFIWAMQALIAAGHVNRHIVPLPSQIGEAFGRVIAEEDIAQRFFVTAREAAWATLLLIVVGIGIGVLPAPCADPARRDRDLGRGAGLGTDRADVSAVPRDLRAQRERPS